VTNRERFRRIMACQPVDALPAVVFEPYEQTAIARWRQEGLPADAHPTAFLGATALVHGPTNLNPLPPFEETVLSDDGVYEKVISGMGAVLRRRKENPSMFYGHIDHPVRTRADWERYKERLLSSTPGRIPADWRETWAPKLNASDQPIGLCPFPFFFRLGFYSMGMERFLTAFHEEPDLIHDMFAHWSGLVMDTIRPLLGSVQWDYAVFGEDLAGKNGPLISPRTYDEFWGPHQTPIIDLLRERGVPVICQWTAGQFDALIPSMLDQGFNCAWPLEVMAGMDAADLRRRYGDRLLLGGNIAKEAVMAGPEAIDAEIARLLPLIREGGFLPGLDDMAAPDMPFEHYRYLIEKVRGIGVQ
jgi:uroporphyrinogen decarboxylase